MLIFTTENIPALAYEKQQNIYNLVGNMICYFRPGSIPLTVIKIPVGNKLFEASKFINIGLKRERMTKSVEMVDTS